VDEVPAGVTTVTSTVPLPEGLVAIICVSETTVIALALLAPNRTDVAPANPLPITVTVVPPPAPPLVGRIAITNGAATSPPALSAAPIISSFFCEPEELPSQNPTAVVAFAIAAPTVRLSNPESLKKNDTTSAPVNVRRVTKDTMIAPHKDTVFGST
jgi:hypothetical protein